MRIVILHNFYIKSKTFVFNKLGINKTISFSILSRLIQSLGIILSIILISNYLTNQEQGYYYTFGSIIAIQVFFELGLNSIITQYTAHEAIHLSIGSNSLLVGDKIHLSRLSSLLHFCSKLNAVFAILLIIALVISGHFFFTKYKTDDIQWQAPWILLCFSTSLLLLISPILAFLEGLGKVYEVAQFRFYQQTLNTLLLIIAFISKAGLWAQGVANLFSGLLVISLIFLKYRVLFFNLYKKKDIWTISYVKEIFPFQYKIALSWISGFFVFQLFNPVLFATEGALVAGQMGMTQTALNGISSISMVWITTKVPQISGLIAMKNYKELDNLFYNTVKQIFIVCFALLCIFIVGIYVLKIFNQPIRLRFLPILPIIFLSLALLANQFIFSWATYLRCHKEEPFLWLSIVGGALIASSTIVLGNKWGVFGIVIGYTFVTTGILFGWAYYIFKTKRKEWHG